MYTSKTLLLRKVILLENLFIIGLIVNQMKIFQMQIIRLFYKHEINITL